MTEDSFYLFNISYFNVCKFSFSEKEVLDLELWLLLQKFHWQMRCKNTAFISPFYHVILSDHMTNADSRPMVDHILHLYSVHFANEASVIEMKSLEFKTSFSKEKNLDMLIYV